MTMKTCDLNILEHVASWFPCCHNFVVYYGGSFECERQWELLVTQGYWILV